MKTKTSEAASAGDLGDGSLWSIGKRHRSALDRFIDLERRWIEIPNDEQDEKLSACAQAFQAQATALRLFFRVFGYKAETPEDASVLAAHGLMRVEQLRMMDTPEPGLDDLARAFAGILRFLAGSNNVDINQIGSAHLFQLIAAAETKHGTR